tara:strand:+ start:3364 stop:3936 length:573 start_codon:yes stop_codon:yes gene_type:complete
MAGLSSKDEAQARSNYFDLKRDETMALSEYLESPVAVKDLKSNPAPKGKKRGGTDVDEDEKPGLLRRLIDQKANRKKYLRTEEGKAEVEARRLHNERMGPKDKATRRRLRAAGKKADAEKGSKMLNKGGTTAKKHIMELPTNVPRLQSGANLMNPGKADLDKDGNLSSYEVARGRAIEKSMNKKKKTRVA